MRVEASSRRRMGEQRRYFPDWTARRLKTRPEVEADHNSYLAGGYAEEFGYRAQPGFSRGVPVLDGEPPEQCQEWQSQARATHPGYPIRPHPFDVDLGRVYWHPNLRGTSPRDFYQSSQEPGEGGRLGTFVAVSDRLYVRGRSALGQRAAGMSGRLVAAWIALRWMLARRL